VDFKLTRRALLVALTVALIAVPLVAATTASTRRSSKWPAAREAHLQANPACEACGEKRRRLLAVHHVVPFQVDATKELDPDNLITLCEGDAVNCHLLFGHLKNWHSWNVSVRQDAAEWREKIKARPMSRERQR
jgi:hypothetical protein